MIYRQPKIFCVCTHNYFRSQIAEFLLRAYGFNDVRSAGTNSAYIGATPSLLVMDAINRRGGDCKFYLVKQLTLSDVEWCSHVLCAEKDHEAFIYLNYLQSRVANALILPIFVVMNVLDGGVSNSDAVERAATQIEHFLMTWVKN